MAQHGHSPTLPSFGPPGSPVRSLSGNGLHGLNAPSTAVYGPQTQQQYQQQQRPMSMPMPPPSPHSFSTSRYTPAHPPPVSNHKSSGSGSMSISSMLGSEPEKAPTQQQQQQHNYRLPARSTTPDQGADRSTTRPYRSNSGSLLQRPSPFYSQSSNGVDQVQSQLQNGSRVAGSSLYGHQNSTAATVTTTTTITNNNNSCCSSDETADRARRTSLGGILHRPDSEPALSTSPRAATTSSTSTAGTTATATSVPPVERPARSTGSYNTRPPMWSATPTSVTPTPNRDSSSRSPELRRSLLNGSSHEPRSLAGLLSGGGPESTQMQRQDSAQSQSSLLGDRHRSWQFSPFAGSVASQTMSTASAPADAPPRKGSDELSHHRSVLGLAHDSKRGRYSPVPQAVKGAQAQTPVPEAALKSEHGRVFAGLGAGLGSSTAPLSAPPTSVPVTSVVSGVFKLSDAGRLIDDDLARAVVSGQSPSGVGKRARKYDEDTVMLLESDMSEGNKRGGARKKTKYGHSYKVDRLNRGGRATPAAAATAATPAATTAAAAHNQINPPNPQLPVFKPKKTIRVSSIIAAAKRLPRRHLGNYVYNPEVCRSDCLKPGFDKFDVSIKPNLLPSFNEPDQVNCTYTVRVSRIWLQSRERSLICKEAYLWGSGLYTDDSDVVAAAMHSGYICSQPPDNVDKVLLDRVVKVQNAHIDGLAEYLPDQPMEPPPGMDAILTLLVLPALERYPASSRFGLTSREWPAAPPAISTSSTTAGTGMATNSGTSSTGISSSSTTQTPHDGVSFAIVKVDFVTGGIEARRMGRTGKERRKRMELEQQERLQSQRLLKVMLDQARKKLKEQGKPISRKPHPLSNVSTVKDGNGNVNGAGANPNPNPNPNPGATTSTNTNTNTALDVGHAPGEWLATAEAD